LTTRFVETVVTGVYFSTVAPALAPIDGADISGYTQFCVVRKAI
jgi:hypothetical protein